MPTKLEKTVKREIEIDGQPYTVAISPEGVKITQKGFRKGQEVTWKELWESNENDAGSTSTGTGGASDPSRPVNPSTGFGGGSDMGYR